MDLADREVQLQKRLAQIKKLEDEIFQRESELKKRENTKKQVLLRITPTLWDKIASWAEDDFRSINSQIEYILNEAVKNRLKEKNQK